MRKEGFQKGQGHGRHGGGRGGHRGGHQRNNNNNNRRRRGPHRGREISRGSADSGNQRERISIESGGLVLIDQFMLANPQFIARYNQNIDEAEEVKADLIKDFGGLVVNVEPGMYRIERDPYKFSIIVHPEGKNPEPEEIQDAASSGLGPIYVDTRCLAMVDRELLDDSALLEKYQQLWFTGQDKACRDLLRDNGGAVRYGFSKYSDDLEVCILKTEGSILLKPKNAPVELAESR